MRLAVSSWYPYQHQAAALEQLVAEPLFEPIELADSSTGLHDVALGPYLALIEDEKPPVVGIKAIVEALHRQFPDLGLLPVDRADRARVRALSDMIEERFSRHAIAAIAAHAGFGRPTWPAGSSAPKAIVDTPPPLSSIEVQLEGTGSRFLVGDRPTMADALMAATWWTIEDQGLGPDLARHELLAEWNQRNCHGDPFQKIV